MLKNELLMARIDRSGTSKDGGELAKALMIHARAFWLQKQWKNSRVEAVYQWTMKVIWSLFEIKVDLKGYIREKSEPKILEVEKKEVFGTEDKEGRGDEEVLDIETKDWAEIMEEEDSVKTKPTGETKRRCYRCMEIPEDGHSFRTYLATKRIYGGERMSQRGRQGNTGEGDFVTGRRPSSKSTSNSYLHLQ